MNFVHQRLNIFIVAHLLKKFRGTLLLSVVRVISGTAAHVYRPVLDVSYLSVCRNEVSREG